MGLEDPFVVVVISADDYLLNVVRDERLGLHIFHLISASHREKYGTR